MPDDADDIDLDAVDEELLAEEVSENDEDDLSDDELVALSGDEADAPADTGRPPDATEVA